MNDILTPTPPAPQPGPKPLVALKAGLTMTAKGVTWTVLKVYPAEVKVQITEEGTGFLRVRTMRRSTFEKNLAAVQEVSLG